MNPWLIFLIVFLVIGVVVGGILLTLQLTGHLKSGSSGSKPLAPATLTAGTPSTSSVQLTWDSSSGTSKYSVSYQVNGTNTWTVFDTTTDTTINVIGLNATTTYNFKVIAVNSSGSSDPVTLNNITTKGPAPTPTNLHAGAASSTSVSLTWTPSLGATSYGISYQQDQSSTWTTVNPTSTSSVVVSPLTPGTTYNFLVTAVNSYGNSISASLTTGTLPVTPTGYSVGIIQPTAIALTWTASSGASSYDVSYQIAGSSTWTDFGQVSTASATVTGLTAGSSYIFQIVAIGIYGASPPITTTAVKTNGLATPPSNLQLGVMTTNTAPLTWNASTDATSYNVLYQPSGGSWTLAQNVATTSYTVGGLNNGTTYTFEVVAVNPYGTSPGSNSVTGTTLIASGNPPSAPTGLLLGTVTSSTANLTWNTVGGATSYTVLYSTNAGVTWKIDSIDGSPNKGVYTVTALSGNASYSFVVTANNTYGSSGYSNSVSVTLPPSAPTNFAVGTITTSSIALSWDAVTGASSYSLSYQTSGGAWTPWPTSGTSTTVTSLTSGAVYNFQLTASSSNGVGALATLSNIQVGFIPGSTTYLVYNSGTVTWQNPDGTTGNILQASTNQGSTWTTIKTFTTATTEFDTTIPSTWWLRVYATNQWGTSTQYAIYA
jgi:fibronectin type 3 domain-containing protein